jgi:hypothetical protein
MHPIALAFFYLMAGMYIVFSILMLRTDRPDTSLKEVRGRFGVQIVFLLLAASMTYLWGRHFVDNRALRVYPPTLRDAAERFGSFFTLNEISPFGFTVWYTLPLLCVFLPCLVFAVRGVRSRWKDPRIATIAAMAAGCFLLYLVVPKEFNTAYHFHRRFSIFSILLILVLAGAWPATTAAWKRMAAVAVAAGLIATFAQNRGSESAIRDIKPALSAPILPAGSRIVEVRFGSYRYRKPLRYVPAMWASAYWAARSHATIMNMPWATQPYYPVQSNGQPDREPIDFGPLFLKAIDDHAPLPMAPDAVVVEMAVDHLDEQKRAIQALENEYGFKPISEPSIDLLVLARKEIRQ